MDDADSYEYRYVVDRVPSGGDVDPDAALRYAEFMDGWRLAQVERAKRVLQLLAAARDTPLPGASASMETLGEFFDKQRAVTEAIRENLDFRSIGYLIDLIASDVERVAQSARAQKRHAENHAMKSDVFAWLDVNFGKQRSMEAAADAMVAAQLVPVARRTLRDWVTEWKRLRLAGTA